jgi:GNAT superfamily N-acetyltransferase
MFEAELKSKTIATLKGTVGRQETHAFNRLVSSQTGNHYDWHDFLPHHNSEITATLFGSLHNYHGTLVSAATFMHIAPQHIDGVSPVGCASIIEPDYMATQPDMQGKGFGTMFHYWALSQIPKWAWYLQQDGLIPAEAVDVIVRCQFFNRRWQHKYGEIAAMTGGEISNDVTALLNSSQGVVSFAPYHGLWQLYLEDIQPVDGVQRNITHRMVAHQDVVLQLEKSVPILANFGEEKRFPVEFVQPALAHLSMKIIDSWQMLDLKNMPADEVQTQLAANWRAIEAGEKVALLPTETFYTQAWSFAIRVVSAD